MISDSSTPTLPSLPTMKTLKILGLVVAVHVIAFIVIFANPGCRSTSSTGDDAMPVAAATPSSPNDEYSQVTPVDNGEPPAQPVDGVLL